MDSDSKDESSASLYDFDNSDNDSDYAETRSRNDIGDNERDLHLVASTSRSRTNTRPPKRPRSTNYVDLDLGGRGSDTHPPDLAMENGGWAEPANGNGEVDQNNLPVFNRISGILENFEPNGRTDVMCYFNAFVDENMFQLMADETI